MKQSGLANRIQIIEADALLLEDERINDEPYDALFIDAAKGQYKRFLKNILLSFHLEGLFIAITCSCMVWFCGKIKTLPRRKRTMIRNLKEFTSWIMTHPDYDTSLTSL